MSDISTIIARLSLISVGLRDAGNKEVADKLFSEILMLRNRFNVAPDEGYVVGNLGTLPDTPTIMRCIDVLRGNLLAGLGPDALEQRDADIAILKGMVPRDA